MSVRLLAVLAGEGRAVLCVDGINLAGDGERVVDHFADRLQRGKRCAGPTLRG